MLMVPCVTVWLLLCLIVLSVVEGILKSMALNVKLNSFSFQVDQLLLNLFCTSGVDARLLGETLVIPKGPFYLRL